MLRGSSSAHLSGTSTLGERRAGEAMLRCSSSAQLSGTLGVRDGPGRRGADRRMIDKRAPVRRRRAHGVCHGVRVLGLQQVVYLGASAAASGDSPCSPARPDAQQREARAAGGSSREAGGARTGRRGTRRDCTRLHEIARGQGGGGTRRGKRRDCRERRDATLSSTAAAASRGAARCKAQQARVPAVPATAASATAAAGSGQGGGAYRPAGGEHVRV